MQKIIKRCVYVVDDKNKEEIKCQKSIFIRCLMLKIKLFM